MSAPSSDGTTEPFWRRKQLEEMTPEEWESLCDGCGKCCLHKIQYEDTGQLCYTNVACKLLDLGTCKCSRYETRQRYVPDCVQLSPENIAELAWMPSTCAYRLLSEGK
ncbi:MAG TPA: YcgN family cysteine cluster protein, partial [Magnetospirillaceae bacterium]|nr:YcgN family cysteine cluster protein [Magnetospirillaceae bacterium]